jgi:hypothetical protein
MLNRLKILSVASCLAGVIILLTATLAQTGSLDLSNAEVIVTSSSNTSFIGMTNTDAKGQFVLKGVPAGGINVVIRRNGQIIAQGAGILNNGSLNEAQALKIVVAPPSDTLKSHPKQ